MKTCNICGKVFGSSQSLSRHKRVHGDKRIICIHCSKSFTRKDQYLQHLKSHTNQQAGGESTQALNDNVRRVSFTPRELHMDPLTFLASKESDVTALLNTELQKRNGLKFYICLKIRYRKYKITEEQKEESVTTEAYHRSKTITLTDPDTITELLQDAIEQTVNNAFTYQRNGSAWLIDRVLKLDLLTATYQPLAGSYYIPLPKKLAVKKAIINVQNKDDKCFAWSVLAALYPRNSDAQLVTYYKPHLNTLKLTGMKFPVRTRQIPLFERMNNGLAVNVFAYDDKDGVYPLHITKNRKADKVINLMLIDNGRHQHYCLIKNLDRLLSDRTKHHGRMYHCSFCLHGYCTKKGLEDHMPYCQDHGAQRIELPTEDDKWFSFNNIQRSLQVPYVIYADFESILSPIQGCSQDPAHSSTVKKQLHIPCGYSYVVVGLNESESKPAVVYRGLNAVDHLLKNLVAEEKTILQKLREVKPMKLTKDDRETFRTAIDCHICEKPLGADRVRDHCHITGKFRGAAHSVCNLNFRFRPRIPVMFHNLRGYDAHLIMQGLGKLKGEPLTAIPNNMEKYVSFSRGSLVFLDTYQFMGASLSQLVKNVATEGMDAFPCIRREFPDQLVPLLLRKGVYPYTYIDDMSRFAETKLPPPSTFYDELRQEAISSEDYAHAEHVWDAFNMTSLADYHDLYVKTDVLLLADVFEHFRSLCMKQYQLDPCHYYTAPGLAWDASLKMTGVQLELLTDLDMHLFVEKGIRGGISMISHRYAKANNPEVPDYDASLPHAYIVYLDANNLYGWAMSEPLPTHEFYWLNEQEMAEFNIASVPTDSEDGYFLEVDLEYPSELHDAHNDYPLAPEHMEIKDEMLSPYAKQLKEKLRMASGGSTTKLSCNLRDKEKYVVHYRNLQLYLSLGLKLIKVHRILTFKQSTWLKPYIQFNTNMRKQANNDFEKDFFKLMNNSVFGKTMENLRKRVNIQLVNDERRLKKLMAKPNLECFRIFNEDLVGVHLQKTKLFLNRPIYVGFSILDLSKVLMFSYHFLKMKPRYKTNITVLFTDTDSLCYLIKTPNLYEDMAQDSSLYDLSNYPPTHHLYDPTNKKVIGKMKDETAGTPILEYVGLRSKMYSALLPIGEKKTAKGVSLTVTRKELTHAHYYHCLFGQEAMISRMKQIRSYNHQLYTIELTKTGLSPFDDKRYILDDGVSSLAYGHYSLN